MVKAETYSIDKGGGEAVGFLDRNDLPGAEATELDVVHTVGRRVWGSIKHVSSIQAIFIRELMVNPGGNKVFIHNLLTGESEFGNVAVSDDGSVRVRVENEVRRRLFIHTIGICVRADRKLSGRAWARRIRSCGIRAEPPSPCGFGRHSVDDGNAFGLPDSFEVGEEECPVLDDRPANCSAKLVPFEGRLRSGGVLEEITRIQCAVAEEFVEAPMKSIGARPGDCVDHSSGSLAVLRGVIAGQNREFLNGIHTQVSAKDATRGPVGIVVETDSVETIIILLWPGARDRQLLAEAAIATIRAHCEGWLRLDRIDSRLQSCQVCPTPTVERQFTDGSRIHHCADIRTGELHGRSFRGHLYDRFCC